MKTLASPSSPLRARKLSLHRLAMAAAMVLVSASLCSAQLVPTLEYFFNEAGSSSVTNTGSASGVDLTMYNSSGNATDLHSADMLGVSGLAGDYAFDNTASTGMGTSGTGGYAASAVTSALASSQSVTVTGWLKTSGATAFSDRAYLFSNGPFQSYGDSVVPTAIYSSISTTGNRSSAAYGATESWVFFALTYDGTITANNLSFYVGSKTGAVSLASTANANSGSLSATNYALSIGNVTGANRPFDGYLDNFRVFNSKTDDSGVLTLSDLESIRSSDVSTIPEPGTLAALLAAGLLFAGRRRYRLRPSLS